MSSKIPRLGRNRALHLIDAENLCGASLVSESAMLELQDAYVKTVPVGPFDQMIFASSHASIFAVRSGWPGHRYEMRSGKDGADICLATIIVDENVANRFARVFMGSGDGGLAPFAAHLASKSVSVTAVALEGSFSAQMRLATSEVLFLAPPASLILLAA